MTPLEIIRQAQSGTLIDEDGHVVTLELLPGLSHTELQDFVGRVPCHIPPEESFQIIDLRLTQPGDGFSWGRYGPNTRIRRFGTHPVFAYKKPKSFISRLLELAV